MSEPTKLSHLALGYQGAANEVIAPNYLKAIMILTKEYDIKQGEEKPRKCFKCDNVVMVTDNHRTIFPETCCDTCVASRVRTDRLNEMQDYWKRICPADYRETKTDHPDFNINAYNRVKPHPFNTSFVLLGTTGSCKTRIACHRAKMALLAGYTVRIAFPEDLKDIPRFISRKEHIAELAKPDVLVMDDAFIAGASKEQVSDFLKDLIDKRIRDQKATIITTQVDSSEYKKDANKFHNITDVDGKRLDAIARRVKEKFVAIDCEDLAQTGTPESFSF